MHTDILLTESLDNFINKNFAETCSQIFPFHIFARRDCSKRNKNNMFDEITAYNCKQRQEQIALIFYLSEMYHEPAEIVLFLVATVKLCNIICYPFMQLIRELSRISHCRANRSRVKLYTWRGNGLFL